MRKTLLVRLARIVTWIAIAAIMVLSLLPGAERPHTGLSGQSEHFLAYGLAGLAASFGYLSFRERLTIWAGLGAASGLFELIQAFIPGRVPEFVDVLASTLGLTTGLILGASLAALVFRRLVAGHVV